MKTDSIFQQPWFWSRLGYLPEPRGMPGLRDVVSEEEIAIHGKYHAEMAANGVLVHTTRLPLGWIGPNRYDYRETDRVLQAVLGQDERISYVPRISLNPPLEWMRKNPSELCVYHGGPSNIQDIESLVGTELHDVLGYDSEKGQLGLIGGVRRRNVGGIISNQSFASRVWIEDAKKALAHCIKHIQSGPWAQRVCGYHVTFGVSGESVYWGGWAGKLADYSLVFRRAFHAWGLERYGSHEGIRSVWGDFPSDDEPWIPEPERPVPVPARIDQFFRSGKNGRVAADWDRFRSHITARAVIELCSEVKRVAEKDVPVGCFYGYFLQCHDAGPMGHLALDELLASSAIDFLAAPISYICRNVGEPTMEMSVARSVNRAGKVWINELDIRTHLTEVDAGYGRTNNAAETISVLWREFASSRASGSRYWWMDLFGGYFSSGEIMASIRAIAEVDVRLGVDDFRPEMAVVVDPAAFSLSPCNAHHHYEAVVGLIYQARISGLPVDVIHLSDLLCGRAAPYKLLIFANPYRVEAGIRRLIRDYIHGRSVSVIWQFAPGVFSDRDEPDVNQCADLTGFPIAEMDPPTSLSIAICDEGVRAAAGVNSYAPGAWAISDGERVSVSHFTRTEFTPVWNFPCLKVGQCDGLNVWGRWSNGENGLVARRLQNAVHVYSALPGLPAELLRHVARLAGCHIYCMKNSAIYAGDGFIALHAHRAGGYEILLPAMSDWRNSVSGQVFESANRISVELDFGQTFFAERIP